MKRYIPCLILALAASCGVDDSQAPTTEPEPTQSQQRPDGPSVDETPTPDEPDVDPTDPTDPAVDPDPEKPPTEIPFLGEWFRGLGATGPEWARSLATDQAGNVFVAGSFDTDFSVAGRAVTVVPGDNEPRNDTFVASYDPTGEFRWIQSFGSKDHEHPAEILVDTDGNVFVIGVNQGDLTFGTTVVPAKGSEDVHIVSYSNDGEFRWAESFGGPYGESPRAAAINDAGQIAITGSYQGIFNAGDTTISSDDPWSAMEVFTMRYDTKQRRVDWVRAFRGFLIDVGTAVAIDDNGDVVVGVSLQYDLQIDANTTFETGEWFDGGIVKLGDVGQVIWSLKLEGSGAEEVIALSTDAVGNVYATGVFESDVTIGAISLANASYRAHDTWLSKIGPDGTPIWANAYGGEGFDQPLGLAQGARGVYLTGRFDGTLDFEDVRLTATDEAFDVFVASFESIDGTLRWARSLGSAGDDQPGGVALDGGRGVYVAGYTSGPLMFNDDLQPAGGFVDAFVLRMEEQ